MKKKNKKAKTNLVLCLIFVNKPNFQYLIYMLNAKPKKRKTIIASVVDPDMPSAEATRRLDELRSLIKTLGDSVVVSVIQKRGRPSGETYVGTGKAREILNLAKELDADQIVFNDLLTPVQIKNLLDVYPAGFEILDRVELILKIFRNHATTEESRMQIELAEIRYLLPRLRGKGKVMSRLGGGIGTRGPGEQQKEKEKQAFKKRISELKKRLEKLEEKYENQRSGRLRDGKKIVGLVGYTNAGKSTLFRTLTKKDTYIANKLFATLDTRIGRVWMPNAMQEILLADTIGFISDLPPFLIESFKTTLAEARNADLILHVIDYSDPLWRTKKKIVEETLHDLNCDKNPRLNIYNKADLVKKKPPRGKKNIFVSAIKKQGLEELKTLIEKHLF